MAKQPQKRSREPRADVLRIRLSEDERRCLDGAAAARNLDTSTWARSELLALAKKELGKK